MKKKILNFFLRLLLYHILLYYYNNIYNTGIRMAIGAFRSNPVDSLLYEANCLTLNITYKFLITKYTTKKMYIPQTPTIWIISKPYHDHRMKPFYIKLYNILDKISFNNIKPIETISIISAWNTNHIEANINCYTLIQ